MDQQAMCSPGHYYPSPAWSPSTSEADYATGGLATGGLGHVKSEPLSPQGALIGAAMPSPRAGHIAPCVTPPPPSTIYHAHMPATELMNNSITGYAPLTPPYNNSNRCDRSGQSTPQSSTGGGYWIPTASTTPPPYESEQYYSSGTCSPSHSDVHETKYSDVLLLQQQQQHQQQLQQHSLPPASLGDKQGINNNNSSSSSNNSHCAVTLNSTNHSTNSNNSNNSSITSVNSSANGTGSLEGFSDDGAFEQLRAICLQQAASDVQVACHILNISPNPHSWDVYDVQRWILWLVKEERLECPPEHMHVFYKVSGTQLVTLCENYQKMSAQQGPQLASAHRVMVEAVSAHLDIWKSAAQTIGCTTSINATSSNAAVTATAVASNNDHNNNNNSSNNNNNNNSNDNIAMDSSHGQQLQITSGIISNGLNSLQGALGCDQQLDDIDLLPYQQLPQVPDYAMPVQQQQQQQHQHSAYSVSHVAGLVPNQMSAGQTLKYSLGPHRVAGSTTGLEMQLNSASSTCSSSIYPVHSSPPLYGDLNEDAYSDDEESSPAGSLGPSGGGQHIHLWQFLKELLSEPHQHHNCIRWLDRAKGIFKIEDSVRVAKLWGRRKNRPAMNYDKLSRSIRQYYRKGIMKKTERSQRLVYQFCPAYAN